MYYELTVCPRSSDPFYIVTYYIKLIRRTVVTILNGSLLLRHIVTNANLKITQTKKHSKFLIRC